MKQLTIRGFDKALQREIETLARRENLSLNKAAVELMRRGAGLATRTTPANVVGDTLDDFIGSWSAEQEREFLDALAPLEAVEESLWR